MTARLRAVKPAVSYTYDEAADAVGCGKTAIKDAIRAGDLERHYISRSRPVILAADLAAWVESRPGEPD